MKEFYTLRTITRIAGGVAVSVGLLVLIGFALDIAGLRSVLPGEVEMKSNSALAFILLGATLFLLQTPGAWVLLVVRGFIVVAGAISILTLAEYASGWNLAIDEILFREDAASRLSRMAPNTAFAFLLLCAALWLLSGPREISRPWIVGGLASIVVTLGLFGIFGDVVDHSSGDRWGKLTVMAPMTALQLISLGSTVCCVAWRVANIRWIINSRLTVTFVCGLMILVAVAALAQRSARAQVQALTWVEHTYEVIGKIRDLRSDLDESQSRMRGYVITGDENYLLLSTEAVSHAEKSFQQLRELTADNADQQARLTEAAKADRAEISN